MTKQLLLDISKTLDLVELLMSVFKEYDMHEIMQIHATIPDFKERFQGVMNEVESSKLQIHEALETINKLQKEGRYGPGQAERA